MIDLLRLLFLSIYVLGAFKVDGSSAFDVSHGDRVNSLPDLDVFHVEDLETVVPAVPVTSTCAAFIDFFGEIASNFTQCVVQYARPLRVCENCVEQYIRTKSAFQYVMKGKHKDINGVDCGEMVLNSDRVQIIVRTSTFITNMWKDCDCDKCFDFINGDNDTVHYKLSNHTVKFKELAAETLHCFHNYSDAMARTNNESGSNISAVCIQCEDLYNDMNSLYNEMEEKSHHHICMDIVDEMNSTRLEWSKEYGCSYIDVDPTAVFVISGVFSLLPIFFYVGNRIQVTRSRRAVINQNEHPRSNNNAGDETQEETDETN